MTAPDRGTETSEPLQKAIIMRISENNIRIHCLYIPLAAVVWFVVTFFPLLELNPPNPIAFIITSFVEVQPFTIIIENQAL